MAHQDENRLEALPLVLLGMRTSFKEDLSTNFSELVYGEPLRLLGKIIKSNSSLVDQDPNNLLHRLQKICTLLRPIPASRHCRPGVFIFKELKNCKFVFVRTGGILKSLQPRYTGPYKVLQRTDKTMKLEIKDKSVTVSIDCVNRV